MDRFHQHQFASQLQNHCRSMNQTVMNEVSTTVMYEVRSTVAMRILVGIFHNWNFDWNFSIIHYLNCRLSLCKRKYQNLFYKIWITLVWHSFFYLPAIPSWYCNSKPFPQLNNKNIVNRSNLLSIHKFVHQKETK